MRLVCRFLTNGDGRPVPVLSLYFWTRGDNFIVGGRKPEEVATDPLPFSRRGRRVGTGPLGRVLVVDRPPPPRAHWAPMPRRDSLLGQRKLRAFRLAGPPGRGALGRQGESPPRRPSVGALRPAHLFRGLLSFVPFRRGRRGRQHHEQDYAGGSGQIPDYTIGSRHVPSLPFGFFLLFQKRKNIKGLRSLGTQPDILDVEIKTTDKQVNQKGSVFFSHWFYY